VIVAFKSPDRMALVSAGIVFLTSAGWFGWGEREVRAVSAGSMVPLSGELEAAIGVEVPTMEAGAQWRPVETGGDPEAWGFDVFTPPVIYYDPVTGRYSVATPEVVEVNAVPLAQPFGVRLQGVERQPYRLQLVGYAGTGEDPLGIFANEVSGEGIVARSGFRFSDLDIDLQSLVMRREELIVPESMPLREIVVEAEVQDRRENRRIMLSSARPSWTRQPVGTLLIEATGELREVVAGDRIELADGVVEITGVFASPSSVTTVKYLPDGTRESQRLVPDNVPDAQFGGDSIFESP